MALFWEKTLISSPNSIWFSSSDWPFHPAKDSLRRQHSDSTLAYLGSSFQVCLNWQANMQQSFPHVQMMKRTWTEWTDVFLLNCYGRLPEGSLPSIGIDSHHLPSPRFLLWLAYLHLATTWEFCGLSYNSPDNTSGSRKNDYSNIKVYKTTSELRSY